MLQVAGSKCGICGLQINRRLSLHAVWGLKRRSCRHPVPFQALLRRTVSEAVALVLVLQVENPSKVKAGADWIHSLHLLAFSGQPWTALYQRNLGRVSVHTMASDPSRAKASLRSGSSLVHGNEVLASQRVKVEPDTQAMENELQAGCASHYCFKLWHFQSSDQHI